MNRAAASPEGRIASPEGDRTWLKIVADDLSRGNPQALTQEAPNARDGVRCLITPSP